MLKSIIAILFGLSLLTACGGGNNDAGKEPESNQESMATQSEGTTLSIEGNDQMQFNKTELKAKAGEKVTLTLKHPGTGAINVMGQIGRAHV